MHRLTLTSIRNTTKIRDFNDDWIYIHVVNRSLNRVYVAFLYFNGKRVKDNRIHFDDPARDYRFNFYRGGHLNFKLIGRINTTKRAAKMFYNSMISLGYVAGGFLLTCADTKVADTANKDIDVYMTRENFGRFVRFISAERSSEYGRLFTIKDILGIHSTLKYIYSGMASNVQNIAFHVHFKINKLQRIFDIVVVTDEIHAINAFDFTFCQIGLHSNMDASTLFSEAISNLTHENVFICIQIMLLQNREYLQLLF